MAMIVQNPYCGPIAITGLGYGGLSLAVEDTKSRRVACGLGCVEETEREYGA